MNKLGMTIDTAHCGDKTTMDTIEVSEKPIVISHVGARALWNSNRMKPDALFKVCAEKGGVIGIEASPHTTITQKHPIHTLESYMEHFEYVANLVGLITSRLDPTRCSAITLACTTPLRANSRSLPRAARSTWTKSSMSKVWKIRQRSFRTSSAWLVQHGTTIKTLPRWWD